MQKEQFIEFIRIPDSIKEENLLMLDELCDEYPYCSSLHKIRLKALKINNSKSYNSQLKMTAAISGNRALLFKYITQNSFNRTNKVLQYEIEPKKLEVGKPLEFDTSDTHSFNEWLKITKFKHIQRTEELTSAGNLKPIDKTNKIVDFITNNSKKKRPSKEFFSPSNMAQQSVEENNHLMTETLAKVYLEQGHYTKAITAYEILCLKYPQKSGLFADQIKAIKQLKS